MIYKHYSFSMFDMYASLWFGLVKCFIRPTPEEEADKEDDLANYNEKYKDVEDKNRVPAFKPYIKYEKRVVEDKLAYDSKIFLRAYKVYQKFKFLLLCFPYILCEIFLA